MTREEKIEKIFEMTKEIIILQKGSITDEELDKLFIQTRIILETYKELDHENNSTSK